MRVYLGIHLMLEKWYSWVFQPKVVLLLLWFYFIYLSSLLSQESLKRKWNVGLALTLKELGHGLDPMET